ncbi:hypothetical protein K4L44_05255 [Halosquirtibacter laminarini]|uniref:Uncharacterized protein n=1 Tax=Halosquirtibacter laminarini TaxID=3374600 RepID=A0AC61NNW4_9BACT|nr:hypothetical protein K4L44_05255 [Prolixibacteraceae bacterium]
MKLKGILVLTLLMVVSIRASYAQKNIEIDKFDLNFDGRLEYGNTPVNQQDNKVRQSEYSMQGFIMYADVRLSNNLYGFYRQEFTGYLNREGGVSTHINMLLIGYDYNHWSFVIGKQPVLNGIYEAFYLPGDVYSYSELSCGFPVWKTGLRISHRIGLQEFGVQILNGDLSRVEAKSNTNPLLLNFYWAGDIGKGLIQTRLNFAGYSKDNFERYSSKIGLHWNLPHILMDTDFGIDNGLPGFAPQKVRVVAAPIQCIWRHGLIRPGFKYIPNYIDNGTDKKFRFVEANQTGFKQQMLMFLELHPWEKDNFHLFALGGWTEYGTIKENHYKALHQLYEFRVGVKFGLHWPIKR